MIDKKRGYLKHRPFYPVDTNVDIQEGMVAFLATNAANVTVATTAASGTVPIGTFWKDAASVRVRSTMETGTFNANNIITVTKGNFLNTASVRVTNAAGTTTYTQGTDYNVTIASGVVTRIAGGAIAALAAVVITYRYSVQLVAAHYENVSTRWSDSVGYNNGFDDTTGSGNIAIVEGDAQIFTDQFDPAQVYTLNGAVRSNAASLWTSAAGAITASGRVVKVPTATDQFLGVAQVRVTA
jgi:hypothetical protein